MKVTALIPDQLLEEVKELTRGETITESLITALSEWAAQEKIKQLNQEIALQPLTFQKAYSAQKVRSLNTRRT